MRPQLYSLSSTRQRPRFTTSRSFDAKWVQLRLRSPRKTHPLDCPVSYPREVLRAKSKARQQRQTPEQVIFCHGYSTRMRGSTLEIDEIRHRRTGRKSSVECHVVVVMCLVAPIDSDPHESLSGVPTRRCLPKLTTKTTRTICSSCTVCVC